MCLFKGLLGRFRKFLEDENQALPIFFAAAPKGQPLEEDLRTLRFLGRRAEGRTSGKSSNHLDLFFTNPVNYGIFMDIYHIKYQLDTPLKFNIGTCTWWFPRGISFSRGPFSGSMFVLGGVAAVWVPTIDPKYRDISADLRHDATSLGQLIVEIQNVQNLYDMPCTQYLNSFSWFPC